VLLKLLLRDNYLRPFFKQAFVLIGAQYFEILLAIVKSFKKLCIVLVHLPTLILAIEVLEKEFNGVLQNYFE
jgi:hypothetical protein